MGKQFTFSAGAMLKWASGDALNSILGRVVLLIETGDANEALLMRNQLVADPKLFIELLETVRPWPDSIVTVNDEELNKHTSIKEIMEFNPNLGYE